MLEFLSWLEGSGLGQAIRASGVWTYGLLNLGHITGVATLFGSVLLLDLRLLGLWADVRLDSIARPTVALAVFGFVLAVGSGGCMLSVNGSEYYGNPFLLIKFAAIGLGVVNVLVVSRMRAWRERASYRPAGTERRMLAVAGALSLVFWSTALGAGRMIGYW
jgi:hypothetical protein